MWTGHPELLASNGGPTLRRYTQYEEEDGNVSQNPYYFGHGSVFGEGTSLGDLDRNGALMHVQRLRQQISNIQNTRTKRKVNDGRHRQLLHDLSLNHVN